MRTSRFTLAFYLLLACPPLRAGLLPDNAFTKDAAGTTAAVFLKSPPGARLEALGQAGAALRGPESLFFNPGGIHFLRPGGNALMAGFESMEYGAGRSHLAWLRAFEPGTLGLGLIYNSQGRLDGYDRFGDSSGSFSPYDLAASLAYSARLSRYASAGASVKYVRSSLAGETGSTAAVDAGLVFRDKSGAGNEFAIAARNFGPPMKLGSRSSPMPLEFVGGFNWKATKAFKMVSDLRVPSDNEIYFTAGAELWVEFDRQNGMFLRGGFNSARMRDLDMPGAVSGGFGFRFSRIAADYAFVPYGELGDSHRLTLVFGF